MTEVSVTTALTEALQTISSGAENAIGNVLPYALSVMGAILIVTIGIKVFKKFTK